MQTMDPMPEYKQVKIASKHFIFMLPSTSYRPLQCKKRIRGPKLKIY